MTILSRVTTVVLRPYCVRNIFSQRCQTLFVGRETEEPKGVSSLTGSGESCPRRCSSSHDAEVQLFPSSRLTCRRRRYRRSRSCCGEQSLIRTVLEESPLLPVRYVFVFRRPPWCQLTRRTKRQRNTFCARQRERGERVEKKTHVANCRCLSAAAESELTLSPLVRFLELARVLAIDLISYTILRGGPGGGGGGGSRLLRT